MKVKYFIFFVLFIIIIPGIWAQECVIEYIEGILEIMQDNTWIEAEQGDILPLTALLKTYDNTLVELSIDNEVYIITAEGEYSLKTIITNGKDVFSWNIGKVVEKKLAFIIEDEMTKYEASMGVRGDDMNPDDLEWMESSEYVVWEGQKLINKGRYYEALEYFQAAFLDAFDENEENTYLFYIGYCHALIGDKTNALIALSKVEVPEEASYYGHYVLLKSRLLAESLSYQKALDLIARYLKKFPEGAYAQAVNFLSAFCYREMNDIEKAIEYLRRAYELDSDTPIGIEAGRQIEELVKTEE